VSRAWGAKRALHRFAIRTGVIDGAAAECRGAVTSVRPATIIAGFTRKTK
jgi:hypothetical protein